MPEDRSLHLNFVVESGDALGPDDFVGLFECTEVFARHVVEQEALHLFTELNLPEEWRLGTMQRVHQMGRRVPVPASVVRVERGSWKVETLVQGAAVLWFLKNYVHPVVQDAWNESRLRELVLGFLREKVFLGARKSLEQKAVASPRYRRLQVKQVSESEQPVRDESAIEVRLERRDIIEAKVSDNELLEDFIRKLRR